MNWRKWFFAGLAGIVAMLVLSYVWYHLLMGKAYEGYYHGLARTPYFLLPVLISYILWGFLMSYIYPIGYQGGSPLKEGIVFGVLVGLLVGLCVNLMLYGALAVPFAFVIWDSLYQIVEKGVAGLFIGLVWGKAALKKASAQAHPPVM
jgi:hypothetical protein